MLVRVHLVGHVTRRGVRECRLDALGQLRAAVPVHVHLVGHVSGIDVETCELTTVLHAAMQHTELTLHISVLPYQS